MLLIRPILKTNITIASHRELKIILPNFCTLVARGVSILLLLNVVFNEAGHDSLQNPVIELQRQFDEPSQQALVSSL